MWPTTHTAPRDGVGANGQSTLSERVKGLRLGDQLGGAKGRGGSSWLPWALCLIMAGTWASFAIRAYSTGGFKALLGGASGEAISTSSEGGKAERSPRPSDEPKAKAGEQGLRRDGGLIAGQPN